MIKCVQKLPIIVTITVLTILLATCKKDNKTPIDINTNTSNKPVASFSFTLSGNQAFPVTATFTNASQRETSYQWYFGDGNTSTLQNPTNTYTAATYSGSPYTVKLVVSNSFGKDSITKQITFASTIITGTGGLAFANSVITITGFNFSPGIAGNSVSINGIPATVNSATSTAITVTVPANAASGPLVLTTNGTTITTNFTVYSLVAGVPSNVYLKHISSWYTSRPAAAAFYDSDSEYIADCESDSVLYLDHSVQGAVGQYVGTFAGYFQQAPAGVKLWGIANGYAVGSNDYRVYKYGTPPNYSVFAGSGVSGYADGQGTAAQFVAPQGMAADAAGNLYVNDAHRVRKISTSGLVTTLAGSGADGNTDGQGTAATFGNLYGIAVDNAGNVYVSDNKYLNIRKITPTGMVTTLAGSGTAGFTDGAGKAAQFYFPKGIAVDALGDVFVSDSNFNTAGPYTSAIRMVNSLGVVTTVLNSNKGDNVSNPDGICIFGGLLVCNTGPGAANQNLMTFNFNPK